MLFNTSPDLAEHIRGVHVDGQRGGVSVCLNVNGYQSKGCLYQIWQTSMLFRIKGYTKKNERLLSDTH